MRAKGKGKFILILLVVLACTLGMGAKTYALVIGVGEFLDVGIPELPGAEKDAQLFARTLEELGVASEGQGTLKLLLNPSLGELIGEIARWSKQGGEEDSHLFFYAGHAETLGEEPNKKTAFIPKDAVKSLLGMTSVTFETHVIPLLKNIPGKQTTLFIDACYSGSVIKERPVYDPKIEMGPFKILAQQKNLQVLVSSRGDETSKERMEGEGGYFTHYLVMGMKGEANTNGDTEIQLGELRDYVYDRVVEQTQDKQHPDSFGEGSAVVFADNTQLARKTVYLLADPLARGDISTEEFSYYQQILYKNPAQYTELERQVRKYLDGYAQSPDILVLQATVKALRERYGEKPQPLPTP
ncbi:MAG TPA: caspase family protein, partial [Thermotogota bacterium]|nr:caspase family protein [Thermotogota bacterium]